MGQRGDTQDRLFISLRIVICDDFIRRSISSPHYCFGNVCVPVGEYFFRVRNRGKLKNIICKKAGFIKRALDWQSNGARGNLSVNCNRMGHISSTCQNHDFGAHQNEQEVVTGGG